MQRYMLVPLLILLVLIKYERIQMANKLSGFIRHNPNRDLNMYDYRAVSPICREIAIHINTYL